MNLFLPPFVATALLLTVILSEACSQGGADLRNVWKTALLVLIFAYFFAIAPSLICTFWMERSYARGLSAASGKALLASGLCGAFSGILISCWFSQGIRPTKETLQLFLVVTAWGTVTGLIVGILVGLAERRALKRR
jgi:hypothetical protein